MNYSCENTTTAAGLVTHFRDIARMMLSLSSVFVFRGFPVDILMK